MQIRLLRDARIRHEAGEVVNVSPTEANFLISVGSGEAVEEPKQKAKGKKDAGKS